MRISVLNCGRRVAHPNPYLLARVPVRASLGRGFSTDKEKIPTDTAKRIMRAMYLAGRSDAKLSAVVSKLVGPPAKQDLTLRNERCVWQILKKHFQRYTPQLVEDVCGTPREAFFT